MSTSRRRSNTQAPPRPPSRQTPPNTSKTVAASATSSPGGKGRALVWTLGVASITAMGTWYGAGLRIRGETKEEQHKLGKASSEERLAQLEAARARLSGVKKDLEKKIEEVGKRRSAQEGLEGG